MTYYRERQRALELFRQGDRPEDIAEKLGISKRSIQRWISEVKNNIPVADYEDLIQEEKQINPIDIVNNDGPKLCKITHKIDEYLGHCENYIDFLNKLSYNHLSAHHNIRMRFQSLLENELMRPEPNFRAIHQLSLGMCRHVDGERQSCHSWDLLNFSNALEAVLNAGYKVYDPTEEKDEGDTGNSKDSRDSGD